MKKLLVAASAIGLLTSAPAMASDGEIALNATVAKACGVGNHKSGAASAPGWDQSDITVDLDDSAGQFSGAEYTNRSLGNVWCNGPASIKLEVSALSTTENPTTDVSSFTQRFDVRVTTDAGVYFGQGQDAVLSTVGQADGKASFSNAIPQAFETGLQRFGGADKIEVLQDGTNRRAVAGTYSGYIRFTATPAA